MKKSKLLILILSIISALCFVFALGCEETPKDDDKIDDSERPFTIVVADFEEWAPDFQLIRTVESFGNMHVNKDMQFVKSGKQSLQIHPLGSYSSGSLPIFFFPTKSELFEFDNSDFTDVDKVTFEFYNNEEVPVKVGVGLVTEITLVNYFSKTAVEFQELQPGWNTITYAVNASALSIDCDLSSIQGIYVTFENAKSRYEEDAYDLYLDDVIIHRYEFPPEILDLIDLDENEYIDFEKDWQQYVVSIKSTANAPDVSIVNASETPISGAEQVSGEKVLKVVAPQGSNKAASYPGIVFSKELLRRSVYGRTKVEDYGTVTFHFDAYNNSDHKPYVGLSFYNSTAMKRYEFGFYLNPHEWTHFSINMKTLYELYTAKEKEGTEIFDDPGTVQIYWAEFIEGGSMELYFDNFHFEVEEKDEETYPEITLTPFVRVAKVGSVVDLPVMTIKDKYDLNFNKNHSITPYYFENGEWVEVMLESGRIPINKAGDYKLVAKAKNSFNNETVIEYPFKGVENVEPNVWASYDYADEISNIYLQVTEDKVNNKTFLEDTSSENLNGEVRYGVVKAETNNANIYGAGYFGFGFADEVIKKAEDAEWISFSIHVYIKASVPVITLYSFNATIAENVPTNCWTEIKVTKKALMQKQTRINELKAPLTSDGIFYDNFSLKCCEEPINNLFFTTSIKSNSGDSKITYYFDKVVWVASSVVNYEDADDWVEDIYSDDYVDIWDKVNKKDDVADENPDDDNQGGEGGNVPTTPENPDKWVNDIYPPTT